MFGSSPKSVTLRKFYGKYFHDIIKHCPLQQRLICGYSANAEDEERFFNQVKGITDQTSNMKNEQILSNLFIRIQAENLSREKMPSNENEISKLWKCIRKEENTVFPNEIITKYPRYWQAHLESISDYVVLGEGVWWSFDQKMNVVFNDKVDTTIILEPKLFHFRDWSYNTIEEKLSMLFCYQIL